MTPAAHKAFRGLGDVLGRFAQSARGGVAMMGAMALPMLLVMAVGAIELEQLISDKSATQDVADQAAIMGAQQLGVTADGATSRAQSFAQASLIDMAKRSTITVTATVMDKGVMKVAIDTHRASFFGNLVPVGGFATHAEATAKAEGMAPLCVLGISASDDVHATAKSIMEAGQCLVHSNRDLRADGATSLKAGAAEAVGAASGPITPSPNTGAAPIEDPFLNLPLTPPSVCNVEVLDLTGKTGLLSLKAGRHCADLKVPKGVTLTLAAGAHWFKGKLEVDDGASLDGTAGVVIGLENGAHFTISGKPLNQNINLKGATSGPLAGFVMVAARDYTQDLVLPADNIDQITGTIYVPNAKLKVKGSSKSGATSPWTVIAAKSVELDDSVDLVINSNYSATNVPVPVGVGKTAASSRLIR